MANKQRGEVTFKAGGNTYTIRFDVNALCEMEDAFDLSIKEIGELLSDGARITDFRRAFAIGLRQCHPDLDEAAAGDLATAIGLDVVGEKIGEAFVLAFPEAEGEPNPPKGATA